MQSVHFKDLGTMDYQSAWDYQERLLRENVDIKTAQRNILASAEAGAIHNRETAVSGSPHNNGLLPADDLVDPLKDPIISTHQSLLFVEHPPVYTLGKSGHAENILITEADRKAKHIEFFNTNRGGDITFHGPGQLVGYPILDLEKFYTDIGRYLRNLEEVMIRVMAEYGLYGERSAGETGVWLEPGLKGKERKIGAIGVRCSRWITMHGFAFNVNTDLGYFNNIIPCGIQNKQVTSLSRELGEPVSFTDTKEKVKQHFEDVFDVELVG